MQIFKTIHFTYQFIYVIINRNREVGYERISLSSSIVQR